MAGGCILWIFASFCVSSFWEGLWSFALQSVPFLPGHRCESLPARGTAACCLHSCGTENCRLTLLFCKPLFAVHFFPFSFLVCCDLDYKGQVFSFLQDPTLHQHLLRALKTRDSPSSSSDATCASSTCCVAEDSLSNCVWIWLLHSCI